MAKFTLSQPAGFEFHHQPVDLSATTPLPNANYFAFCHADSASKHQKRARSTRWDRLTRTTACCPILTPGFGTWERTGLNTFALTFASFLYNNAGSLVATGQGHQSITMTSSNQFVGKAKFVLTKPDGTPYASGATPLIGKRVRVRPLR